MVDFICPVQRVQGAVLLVGNTNSGCLDLHGVAKFMIDMNMANTLLLTCLLFDVGVSMLVYCCSLLSLVHFFTYFHLFTCSLFHLSVR